MLNVPMVFVYICLVVAILIVPSIILLVKSKGKQKSFFLYSLIPMIIAIGLLSLISYYTHEELEQKRQVEAYKNYCEIQIENFKDDYNYMLSEWEKINNDPNYVFEFDTSKLAYETTKTNFVNYFIEVYNDENIYKDRYTKYDYSSSYETYGLEISFYVSPKNELVLDENNNIVYEKLTTHIYNLPATNTNADYSQSKNALTQLENAKDRIIVGTQFNVVKDHDMLFYICMLVVLSITIVLNIITIILCLVRKQDKGKSETNNIEINIPNKDIEEDIQEQISWEVLEDKEIKDTCYTQAIRLLYAEQLDNVDNKWNLTKQEKALKQYSLDNEDFDLDELNEEERKEVETYAKSLYDDVYLKLKSKINKVSKEEQAEIEKEYNLRKKKCNNNKIISWCLVGSAIAIGLVLSLLNSYLMFLAVIPILIVNAINKSTKVQVNRIKYLYARNQYYNNCSNVPQLDENKTPKKYRKIESIVYFSIAGVFAVSGLIFMFINSSEISTFSLFAIFMAMGFGLYGFMCKSSLKLFCKKCGYEGLEMNDEVLSSHNKLERKILLYDIDKTTAKGHVSYDNKGNAYEEQVKTFERHKRTYKCSMCGETWSLTQTEEVK